jgi:hypothetical protein
MSKHHLINLVNKLVAKSPVLKEQRAADPNAFETEVEDVSFSGLDNYFPEYKGRDMDISYLKCRVNWRYDLGY